MDRIVVLGPGCAVGVGAPCSVPFLTTRRWLWDLRPKARCRVVMVRAGADSSSYDDGGSDRQKKLDEWEKMELDFGRLLGEDPNITLAKIMAKRSNPDISSLDVEKALSEKKKMKASHKLEGLFINVADAGNTAHAAAGNLNINLSRPTMRDKLEGGPSLTRADLSLSRPAVPKLSGNAAGLGLRKPIVMRSNDSELEKKLQFKPSNFMKMTKAENLSNISLLKKPEVLESPSDKPNDSTSVCEVDASSDRVVGSAADSMVGVQNGGLVESIGAGNSLTPTAASDPALRFKPIRAEHNPSEKRLLNADSQDVSSRDFILRKPQSEVDTDSSASGTPVNESAASSREMDVIECEWERVEQCIHSNERVEVELISCSGKGFVVSLSSLLGFLPYRNLGIKWKFSSFETWLSKKGLDPFLHMKNSGVAHGSPGMDGSALSKTKLENLLQAYDEEKIAFLSSFIGQRIRVSVVSADRNSKRIIFSGRPKEKEGTLQKKRDLMARLIIGDIVKCCVRRISYFGIFVEVEGVPALIHQTEVSWDGSLDPSLSFQVGQILNAKVQQLDHASGRIFLSLKEVLPDPLMESLESVIHNRAAAVPQASQAEAKWPDVDSLINKLRKIDGITNVDRGQFFLSPGLAPAFQVYMAPTFDSRYKLLARFENKVQEVWVESTLDKEKMKSAIQACASLVG